jgi:hypothetical protein
LEVAEEYNMGAYNFITPRLIGRQSRRGRILYCRPINRLRNASR